MVPPPREVRVQRLDRREVGGVRRVRREYEQRNATRKAPACYPSPMSPRILAFAVTALLVACTGGGTTSDGAADVTARDRNDASGDGETFDVTSDSPLDATNDIASDRSTSDAACPSPDSIAGG